MIEKKNKIYFNEKVPWLDARWVVLIGNFSLLVIAICFFHLQRSWEQIAITLILALATEFCLFRLSQKYLTQSFGDRWASPVTEAMSCLVLARSKTIWLHGLMVVIAIFSKYLIRKNKSDHIFNPANFAVVMVAAFFPYAYYEFRVDDYSASAYPLYHVMVVGLLATIVAKVWKVALAYFVACLLSAMLMYHSSGLILAVGPELGASSLIFGWLMITDPKSAPRASWAQICFGALIGLVHILLRAHEVVYSRFFALYFVTAGFFIISTLAKKNSKSPAVTKETSHA